MRLLIAFLLLVGASFLILFALTDLVREFSRHSFLAAPDLDDGDDWEERQEVGRYPIERMRGDHVPGSLNALDDLRSAL
jgi:hypothetical protein